MSINSSTQRSKRRTYRFIAREQRSSCVDVERRRESTNEWSRDESTIADVFESRAKSSSSTRAWLSSNVDISSCVSKRSNKRDRRSSRDDERNEHIINVVSQTLSCVSCLFVCSFIVWLTSRDNREVNRRAHRERHEQDVRDRSHKSKNRRRRRKRRERNRCEDSEVERLNQLHINWWDDEKNRSRERRKQSKDKKHRRRNRTSREHHDSNVCDSRIEATRKRERKNDNTSLNWLLIC